MRRKKDYSKVIARANADGISVTEISSRTLGLMESLYEEIDRRENMRKHCVINVKAICEALGISRPNVMMNPYLKAVVERHKALLPDVTLCKRLEKLEKENAKLEEWHRKSVSKDMEAIASRKKEKRENAQMKALEKKYEITKEALKEANAKIKELEETMAILSSQVTDAFITSAKSKE